MKRPLWVAAFLLLLAPMVLGQSDPKLAVEIRFSKTTFSIHDKVEFEILRENIGHDALAISSLWFWGVMRTDVHVFDKAGHEIETQFLADSVPYPPKPYDFVVIEPGEFLGTRLKEDANRFVNAPGEYDFVVQYTCELSDDWAMKSLHLPPDIAFWSREHGTISSSRVRVRITP